MATVATIWIIDDDEAIRLTLGLLLTREGYDVVEFADGADVVGRLGDECPDLIILDVIMPRLDGWATLTEIRKAGCVARVIMITDRNDIASRVRGLELGADDYLGKPCTAAEVIARVRAHLRRIAAPSRPTPRTLHLGDVTIDFEKKIATKAGEPLRLTRTDFAILSLLSENAGRPVSRAEILRHAWKGAASSVHALDTHFWRLRKKLGDSDGESQFIRNLPGIGFVLDQPK
jgi:DNA-binding response OmpR family regulator